MYGSAFCGCVLWFSYPLPGIDFFIGFLVNAKQTEVISLAAYYTRISSVFYFNLAVLFIYRNGLQGSGQRQGPIISSCIEMAVKNSGILCLDPVYRLYRCVPCGTDAWSLMGPCLMVFFYRDLKRKEQQLEMHTMEAYQKIELPYTKTMAFAQDCRCHFYYATAKLYKNKNRYPRKQDRSIA